MNVELCLYASFMSRLPANCDGNTCIMELSEGTTIRQLLDRIGIPEETPKLLFVNGLHAKEHDVLKGGDRLAVFPPIAGG